MTNHEVRRQKLRYHFSTMRGRIRELEEALANRQYYAEEAESRAVARAREAEREDEYQRREAESARYYQEDKQRRLVQELERARSYGNKYEEDRIITRMKRGY